MAPYGARDGDYYASTSSLSLSTNGIQDDPKYLILHESIKLLVKEVLDLKDRCDGLEANNNVLRQELEEQKMRAVVQQIPKQNLTGYAASEASEQNCTKYDLDVARARDVPVVRDSTQALTDHEEKLQDLHCDFVDLADRVRAIETTVDSYEPPNITTPPPGPTEAELKQIQDEIASLQVFQRKTTSLQDQERVIDDAASKEVLSTYFEELSAIIVSSDQPFTSKGKFRGNFDDLFTLRSRVVRRLALHEQYEAVYKDIMKR